MPASTYAANKMLDHLVGKTAFAMPATVYVALFISNPTAANTGTEASFTGYARVALTTGSFNAAASGSSANATAISFPTKTGAADQTITHWGTYDAASAGNLIEFGALTASAVYTTGATETFAVGQLVRTAT